MSVEGEDDLRLSEVNGTANDVTFLQRRLSRVIQHSNRVPTCPNFQYILPGLKILTWFYGGCIVHKSLKALSLSSFATPSQLWAITDVFIGMSLMHILYTKPYSATNKNVSFITFRRFV